MDAMTEDVEDEAGQGSKGFVLPMVIGIVLALGLGGAGFYLAYAGFLSQSGESQGGTHGAPDPNPIGDIDFVVVEPMVISLGAESGSRHLRFRAQLEVPKGSKPDVERLLPRVMDIFNSYLRAVDLNELESPSNLSRLRAQMLRRVQMVVGKDRVNDLLIMEFVLN